MRLADRLPVRGHPAEPFSLAALHHAPTGADPFMHTMIRSTGVPIKRFIPLGIDVVGERVSKGVADCGSAVQAAHERDLPLLFMTDRMRHDLVMRSTKSRSKDEASADPSFATSAVSSRPGIDARSSAEQICIGSPNQLAHQRAKILASPLWLAAMSFERARRCGSLALSTPIKASRIP